MYDGVRIDYRGADVTANNFLSVLLGDAAAMAGKGTGRVVDSGPHDKVGKLCFCCVCVWGGGGNEAGSLNSLLVVTSQGLAGSGVLVRWCRGGGQAVYTATSCPGQQHQKHVYLTLLVPADVHQHLSLLPLPPPVSVSLLLCHCHTDTTCPLVPPSPPPQTSVVCVLQ